MLMTRRSAFTPLFTVLALAVFAGVLAGCTSSQADKKAASSAVADQGINNAAIGGYYDKIQPIQLPDGGSQYRQTLQEAQLAMANGYRTWTIATEQGVPEPMFECPSVGPAVPENATVTPTESPVPVDSVGDGNDRPDHLEILETIEPTLGAYLGDGTNGTYAICVYIDPTTGESFNYLARLEMNANQFTIPHKWDPVARRIVVDEPKFREMREKNAKALAQFTDCGTDPKKCVAVNAAKPDPNAKSTPEGGNK